MAEKIFVENLNKMDPFNFGVISYKVIADYIFMDLAVAGALRSIRILIDIEKPFFYIQGKLSVVEEIIHVSDITTIYPEDGGIHIVIKDESYAPELLKVLWNRFGRENVTQMDRWNLKIPKNLIKIEELKQMTASNPRERILNKILDAFNRIIPEGFRIRKNRLEKDYITIIASENPLQDKWIQQAEETLKRPPLRIPKEYLEKLKQIPKTTEKKVIPWKTHDFQESTK